MKRPITLGLLAIGGLCLSAGIGMHLQSEHQEQEMNRLIRRSAIRSAPLVAEYSMRHAQEHYYKEDFQAFYVASYAVSKSLYSSFDLDLPDMDVRVCVIDTPPLGNFARALGPEDSMLVSLENRFENIMLLDEGIDARDVDIEQECYREERQRIYDVTLMGVVADIEHKEHRRTRMSASYSLP